jgi:transcriptional regulator with XRE-family HTH domain
VEEAANMASLGQQLGQRVRERRKAVGLSQEALAEKIGIAASFLGRIERGVTMPSVPTLVRLSTELQMSSDSLLGLDVGPSSSTALDLEVGLMLSALAEGDVTKINIEGAGQVAGLVPKALRERLHNDAVAVNTARRNRLTALLQRASPKTILVLTLVAEAMEPHKQSNTGTAQQK